MILQNLERSRTCRIVEKSSPPFLTLALLLFLSRPLIRTTSTVCSTRMEWWKEDDLRYIVDYLLRIGQKSNIRRLSDTCAKKVRIHSIEVFYVYWNFLTNKSCWTGLNWEPLGRNGNGRMWIHFLTNAKTIVTSTFIQIPYFLKIPTARSEG